MKKQSGFGVVGILILVVVFVAASAGGWFVYRKLHTKKRAAAITSSETNTAATAAKTDNVLTPQQVMTTIKTMAAKSYKTVDDKNSVYPMAGEMRVYEGSGTPYYMVEGYTYYVNADGGASISFTLGPSLANDTYPRQIDSDMRTAIEKVYTDLGLSKSESYSADMDMYQGKGLLCAVDAPSAPTSTIFPACGSFASYLEMAQLAKPFATVLPNTDEKTALLVIKITEVNSEGYQTARLNVGSIEGSGYAADFYRKGDAEWTFFKGHQDIVMCSDYNSAALKAAFAGVECANSDGITTSKVGF